MSAFHHNIFHERPTRAQVALNQIVAGLTNRANGRSRTHLTVRHETLNCNKQMQHCNISNHKNKRTRLYYYYWILPSVGQLIIIVNIIIVIIVIISIKLIVRVQTFGWVNVYPLLHTVHVLGPEQYWQFWMLHWTGGIIRNVNICRVKYFIIKGNQCHRTAVTLKCSTIDRLKLHIRDIH